MTSTHDGALVRTGGEVLLSGVAIADVARALRLAQRVAARDGIRLNPMTARLIAAVEEALHRQASAAATGSAELPVGPPLAPSNVQDTIGTQEAAQLMNRTDRGVRDLCARGSLATARRAGRRWVVDRSEVLDLVERRDP